MLRAARLLTGLALLFASLGVAAPAGAADPARNTYTSWRSAAGFDAGSHEATAVSGGRLVASGSVGTRRMAGRTYQVGRWTSPWVTPAHTFTQVVPSWNASTPSGTVIEVRLRVRSTTGAVSTFDTLGTWTTRDGELRRTSSGSQSDDLASVATDTLRANGGRTLRSWQLRVLLLRTKGAAGPSVRSVGAVASHLPSSLPATSAPVYRTARTLDVPAYSQMTHRGEYPQYGGGGEAWCSPTSLAMLLGYYDALPSPSSYAWVSRSYRQRWVDHVARMTFDWGYDGTGNWPFNTAYAGVYVDDAFVTRMASLRGAERFVHAGIPLAASISFSRGQLRGAPISATEGHLVVIVGFTRAGNVVVNDPAAASSGSVRRTYDRGQFERAWLRKSGGLAYVVHDAAHPLPARHGATNW